MTAASISLALTNSELYAGCVVEEVAGRLTLMTPTLDATNIIGRNAQKMVDQLVADGVENLTLTGAMAIWAYLIVFHCAVHRFRRIYYDDGKAGEPILIAAH